MGLLRCLPTLPALAALMDVDQASSCYSVGLTAPAT